MKSKILILISLLFLLCGCTAEVNLEIEDDLIKEKVTIDVEPSGDYTMERLPKAFRLYIPIYAKDILPDAEPDRQIKGVTYYNRKQERLNNGYRFTYSYNFKLNKYEEARTIKNGFKSSNIFIDNVAKTILLSTDNSGMLYFSEEYPLLNRVKINIKTNYKVEEHNADRVNGNIYTWEFTKNDNHKNIYLLLDKTKDNQNTEIEKPQDPDIQKPTDKFPNKPTTEDNKKPTKKEENTIQEEMNKHPYLFIIGAIVLFFIVIFILTKIIKITKVK